MGHLSLFMVRNTNEFPIETYQKEDPYMMCNMMSRDYTWDVDVRDTNCPRESGAGVCTTKPFTVATRQSTRREYTWFIMVYKVRHTAVSSVQGLEIVEIIYDTAHFVDRSARTTQATAGVRLRIRGTPPPQKCNKGGGGGKDLWRRRRCLGLLSANTHLALHSVPRVRTTTAP